MKNCTTVQNSVNANQTYKYKSKLAFSNWPMNITKHYALHVLTCY